MYLSLNGDIIPNHGYVVISDIGSTDNTALICRTNHLPLCEDSVNSGGNWFDPNGTTVNSNDVPGFRRNRIIGIVRLFRSTGSPPEGIYSCIVQDTTFKEQTRLVGLYDINGGNCYTHIIQKI